MGLFKKKKKEYPPVAEPEQTATSTDENVSTVGNIEDDSAPKDEDTEKNQEQEADSDIESVGEKPENLDSNKNGSEQELTPAEKERKRPMEVVFVKREDPALKSLGMEMETPEHPLHCTDMSKFMSTMWFVQETLLYTNKDERFDFEVTTFPLASRADGFPVPIVMAIRRGNVFKSVISAENYSVSMVYEGLIVNCTGFFKDKVFDTRISVIHTGGVPAEIETLAKRNFHGSILPMTFGLKVPVGQDTVEIFPLASQNDSSTGCVPFLWIHQKANGDVFYGTSDQNQKANIATTDIGVKTIISYWNNGQTKYNAEIS